jgi:hypothetical protein
LADWIGVEISGNGMSSEEKRVLRQLTG